MDQFPYKVGSSFVLMLVCWIYLCDKLFHLFFPITFFCVLSVFTLIELLLIALFSPVIRRDSFSLLKFLFFSHVQVFSFTILPVSFFLEVLFLFYRFCIFFVLTLPLVLLAVVICLCSF